MEDPVYLDAINSLLISGEYPHLFTNDEMDGLLQVNIIDRLTDRQTEKQQRDREEREENN